MEKPLTHCRPTNLPSGTWSPLRPRRGDDHCLLGGVSGSSGRDLDVVSSREPQEDPFYCPTGICETGEPRVSDNLLCNN